MSILTQRTATETRILDKSVRDPHIIMGLARDLKNGKITAELTLEVPSGLNTARTIGYQEGLAMVKTPITPVAFDDYMRSYRSALSKKLLSELKAMQSFSSRYLTTDRDSGPSRQ